MKLQVLCLALRICAAFGTAVDPLESLNDEFDDPGTLTDWKRAYQEDGFQYDLIESAVIENGQFTALPYSSGWFQELRGNFFFKELTGDFVMTANVTATGRSGPVPSSSFSLGGLMVRRPNSGTGNWIPNNELWTFLAMGTGTQTSVANEFEVKTTVSSGSTLELRTVDPDGIDNILTNSVLQIARFGNNLMLLVQPNGKPWEVLRCYGTSQSGAVFPHSEIPAENGILQVGMNMYTDFPNWDAQPDPNNSPPLLLNESNPDLRITYDYIRFCTPGGSPLFNQDWFDTNCNPPHPSLQWNTNCCISGVEQILSVLGENGDNCQSMLSSPTESPTTAPTSPTNAPTTAPSSSSSSSFSLRNSDLLINQLVSIFLFGLMVCFP